MRTCLFLCLIGFSLSLAVVASASELEHPSPAEIEAAWKKLVKRDEVDIEELTGAIVTIIRSNDSKALEPLVKELEGDSLLKKYSIIKHNSKRLEYSPFRNLTLQVALCKSDLAERVLMRCSESETITGKMKKDVPGGYKRGIAVIFSLGYLQPRMDSTYTLLKSGISGHLNLDKTYALRSLARIGDNRAADVIYEVYFRGNRKLSMTEAFYLTKELGQHRDQLAIFTLLLKVTQDPPIETIRSMALQVLVDDKSLTKFPHEPRFTFPDYSTLSEDQRKAFLQLTRSVESDDFEPSSVKMLQRLQDLLKQHDPPKSPPK